MNRLLPSLALLLLAGTAAAQTEPPEDARKLEYDANYVARRLLTSDDTREIAWGASLAARHGLADRIPDLRRKLAEATSARSPAVARLILDALIRLEASVPADELMAWFDRCPDEVIMLLARAPHANREALLEVLERRRQTVHWLAAGGLLAKVKSAAFADYLVRRMRVTLDVTVAEKETAVRGINGAIAAGVGGPRAYYRRGLPPVAHYRLVTAPERGATVLCAGPCPVFAKRFASRAWPARRTSSRDTRYYACRFLAEMADAKYAVFDFVVGPGDLVIWNGPKDLTARVAKLRGERLARWQTMIDTLVAAKLLDRERVAPLKPRIEVRLHDMREEKSEALPEIAP